MLVLFGGFYDQKEKQIEANAEESTTKNGLKNQHHDK